MRSCFCWLRLRVENTFNTLRLPRLLLPLHLPHRVAPPVHIGKLRVNQQNLWQSTLSLSHLFAARRHSSGTRSYVVTCSSGASLTPPTDAKQTCKASRSTWLSSNTLRSRTIFLKCVRYLPSCNQNKWGCLEVKPRTQETPIVFVPGIDVLSVDPEDVPQPSQSTKIHSEL